MTIDHPGYPGQCCDTAPCTCQPLDLDPIRQRCDAATPGRWWNDGHEIYAGEHVGIPDMCTWIGETCVVDFRDYGAANAALVAHARQDVPALIAEIERLRAENVGLDDLKQRAIDKGDKDRARVAELEAANEELTTELGGRDEKARKRWIKNQEKQLGIRFADFRNGRWEMDLAMGRDMAAAYVAMAKTMLGDAPNYTETKIEFDVKVAESPETYTLVVQRHAPGALTPHEARQRAEYEASEWKAEAEKLRAEAAAIRAAAFSEAARLLEDTGRDDDAVNLLDNVADGIRTNATP